MLPSELLGPLAGAILLGAVHGIEPGHGWPVAASYALDQTNKWVYGFAASFLIGFGHLVSSIAMVAVFFYAKNYFDLTQVNEPIAVFGAVQIGGPVSLVAGVLLIALGVREYLHGHSHGTDDEGHDHEHSRDSTDHHDHDPSDRHDHHDHGPSDRHDHHDHGPSDHHDHSHDPAGPHDRGHDHSHDHGDESGGLYARLKGFVPFAGGHSHSHGGLEEGTDRGLLGIAWFAFVLGFAHEEEFEIIALCAGSNYCLELMSAYALTVIAGIVGLTLLLIAGYHRSQERVEQYAPYLPAFSAAVLVVMGVGFIFGLF
ncbi:sulfite exporter TauE/SafE family protein [Halorubrum sodomense]|uniref:High-affinity nickel-transport protein n=1 Tax=Halorubrum sodomense TaxID=35743 RepID=A0A1I6FM77_HALSD|nr:hypothetical protein [Halorubrum sodomense]SFR30954.1 hypothetical protein SAMN04487937_0790 [Halorubrum sodomense]